MISAIIGIVALMAILFIKEQPAAPHRGHPAGARCRRSRFGRRNRRSRCCPVRRRPGSSPPPEPESWTWTASSSRCSAASITMSPASRRPRAGVGGPGGRPPGLRPSGAARLDADRLDAGSLTGPQPGSSAAACPDPGGRRPRRNGRRRARTAADPAVAGRAAGPAGGGAARRPRAGGRAACHRRGTGPGRRELTTLRRQLAKERKLQRAAADYIATHGRHRTRVASPGPRPSPASLPGRRRRVGPRGRALGTQSRLDEFGVLFLRGGGFRRVGWLRLSDASATNYCLALPASTQRSPVGSPTRAPNRFPKDSWACSSPSYGAIPSHICRTSRP